MILCFMLSAEAPIGPYRREIPVYLFYYIVKTLFSNSAAWMHQCFYQIPFDRADCHASVMLHLMFLTLNQ